MGCHQQIAQEKALAHHQLDQDDRKNNAGQGRPQRS
jgi:hypothetical protein